MASSVLAIHHSENYSNSSDSEEQEPWVVRGGLICEMHVSVTKLNAFLTHSPLFHVKSLLLHECNVLDMFNLRPIPPPSEGVFSIRPFRHDDIVSCTCNMQSLSIAIGVNLSTLSHNIRRWM